MRHDLPDVAELLELEGRVRHGGSGLQSGDLLGCWWLDQIWPKGQTRAATVSAALLRGLSARLEITTSGGQLELSNAVTLGVLELRFRGPGWLTGIRPLLRFRFDVLTVSLAGRRLLERRLPQPAATREPFFALIGRSPEGWMAARGRGGGLALWRLRGHPATDV
ncbi:MAG: hypothetical protein WCF98_03190 [Synechococcus sp. ELA057]|jgi:hypothetical protein